MAWTTPATFTTGNVLTAAQMNTNVRDNTNFLHDPPGCQISKTGNQAFASGTGGAEITMGTIIYDTDSMTGTANRITTTTAGVYHFSLSVEWAAQAGGTRSATIFEGTGFHTVGSSMFAPAGSAATNSCSGDYVCTAGLIFQQNVWQNSGSTVNILGTSSVSPAFATQAPCYFSAHWVGAG